MTRRGRVLSLALSVLVAVAVVVSVVAVSYAQMQPGQGGQQGGRERMGRMGGQMWGPAMATPAIAVAGDKVFVAAGGRLYRFNAITLELEAEAVYAEVQMPPMPGGGIGGPPGMPGGAPAAPAQ